MSDPRPTPASRRTRRADLAVAIALFAGSLAWFSGTWDGIFEPRDEGYLLAQAAQVAEGRVPHRDFTDIYGPGVFAVTGAALALGDGQMLSVRRCVGALKALAVVLTYAAARFGVGVPWAATAAVLAAVFWGRPGWNLNTPYASLFTIPVCQLALLGLLLAERRRSSRLRFAAGVGAGIAVLFKQSLAILMGFGLSLAILALGLLLDPPAASPRGARASAALWAGAGALLVVPLAPYLDPAGYLIHLLPIHCAMALVWVAATWRPGGPPSAALLTRRLGPWLAGAGVAPALTALFYLAAGGLDRLAFDMFALPALLVNYAVAAPLPPWPVIAALCGAVALVAGGLQALDAGDWPVSASLAVAGGAILLALAIGGAPSASALLVQGGSTLQGVQIALLGWAGILTLALPPRRLFEGGEAGGSRFAVPILFFHLFLCFQGFPRSGPDVQLTQGAQMLLLGALLPVWLERALPAGRSLLRRGAALALLGAVPAWLAGPVLATTLQAMRVPMRELRFPAARGIQMERGSIERNHVDDLERLVARLHEPDLGRGPIVVVGNTESIAFLGGHPSLFADRRAYLFWLGWGMLPAELMGELDEPELVRRLAGSPDALVVDVDDGAGRAISIALPELRRFIDSAYAPGERFGPFQLRRRRS